MIYFGTVMTRFQQTKKTLEQILHHYVAKYWTGFILLSYISAGMVRLGNLMFKEKIRS